MTETNHGHGNPAANPFSEQEWANFHKDDVTAGKVIVLLMATIFSVGLVLYTSIAYICLPPS